MPVTRTFAGTSCESVAWTVDAIEAFVESGSDMPASVAESTRTEICPSAMSGVAVITNCVDPKSTLAIATRRTLLDMTFTTGSDTVTPETVCGKPPAAALVSSASDTVIANAADVGRAVAGMGLAVTTMAGAVALVATAVGAAVVA